MIADGNVLVVRQQRIIGTELLADIGGMMNADVEIGVVADMRRQVQRAGFRSMQARLHLVPVRIALCQQFGQPQPQSPPRSGTECQEGIERRTGSGLGSPRRLACKEARGESSRQVQNLIADGHASPLPAGTGAEDPERQVLDGKVLMTIGRRHPAFELRIMGLIDLRHRPTYLLFGLKCFLSLCP